MPRNAKFTVTLSEVSSREIRLNYTTVPGTALANTDFTPVTGELIFDIGDVEKDILIPVRDAVAGDIEMEFSVHISEPINGSIIRNIGICIVPEAQAAPGLSSFFVVRDLGVIFAQGEKHPSSWGDTFIVNAGFANLTDDEDVVTEDQQYLGRYEEESFYTALGNVHIKCGTGPIQIEDNVYLHILSADTLDDWQGQQIILSDKPVINPNRDLDPATASEWTDWFMENVPFHIDFLTAADEILFSADFGDGWLEGTNGYVADVYPGSYLWNAANMASVSKVKIMPGNIPP